MSSSGNYSCTKCHITFRNQPIRCYECGDDGGGWCSHFCRQNDNDHPAWCKLIQQSYEDEEIPEEIEEIKVVEEEEEYLYKPWHLLGAEPQSGWPRNWNVALEMKLKDMNDFQTSLCKNDKPCNCPNCTFKWTAEHLGIVF